MIAERTKLAILHGCTRLTTVAAVSTRVSTEMASGKRPKDDGETLCSLHCNRKSTSECCKIEECSKEPDIRIQR